MNNDSQNFTENVDPLILNKFVELTVSKDFMSQERIKKQKYRIIRMLRKIVQQIIND